MENIKLSLVEDILEVLENIKGFNHELPDSVHLIKKLSHFKHWYYSNELNLFGPSKFIGYKKNTTADYEKGTTGAEWYMDGRDTEPVLRKWSIETEGPDFMEYKEKLTLMLAQYDKKPISNVHIHLIR
jgi:hypothetical protein